MVKKKKIHPLRKAVDLKPAVIGASVVGILVMALTIVSLPAIFSFLTTIPAKPITRNQVVPPESPVPTQTPTISPTPWPPRTFISRNLGISFDYSPLDGKVSDPVEIGNKIYVDPYPNPNQPNTLGPFSLQVFKKDPSDNITEAIRKKFMQGTIPSDCQLGAVNNISGSLEGKALTPKSYISARIRLRSIEGLNLAEVTDRFSQCLPGIPDTINVRLSYFMMDTNHPDKLLYFNMGQTVLPSGKPNLSWNDTIRFITPSN